MTSKRPQARSRPGPCRACSYDYRKCLDDVLAEIGHCCARCSEADTHSRIEAVDASERAAHDPKFCVLCLSGEHVRAAATRDGIPRSTGMWVVCVYESPDYLLAIHGPYNTHDAAAVAAAEVKAAPGIYAVYDVPLWDVRDLKMMVLR